MLHSPPSSGRRTVYFSTVDIQPTLESRATQGVLKLINQITTRAERPVALIVNQEEEAEIRGFMNKIERPHGCPAPTMLESWSDEVLHLTVGQGLFVRHASSLSPVRLEEVDELVNDEPRRSPFVLCFRSTRSYQRALVDYGEHFWSSFYQDPIVWPKVAERAADWPGIIREAHAVLRRRDQRPVPDFDPDAAAAIMGSSDGDNHQKPTSVFQLTRLVCDAVELAVLGHSPIVTRAHVSEAWNARLERAKRQSHLTADP